MNISTAIITCPNPGCKAPNSLDRPFCQKCQTYVPKRYLWAIGSAVRSEERGRLIGDRYLVVDKNILLDTQPGTVPIATEDIPPFIACYLKLSGYQPQMPKVYGLAANPDREEAIWLLENAPIYSQGVGAKFSGSLLPRAIDVWTDRSTPPLRQLNWLAQILELWQPMVMERVASTLLSPECLRVEGSLLRVLELIPDRQVMPNLSDLGKFWQQNLPSIHPGLAEFWQVLCERLVSGQYLSSEQVLDAIATAMNDCASGYDRLYQIATYSDKGPTRSRNEDACYPNSATFLTSIAGKDLGLTIVCDGIGGHEGGNVASNMAIEIVRADVERSLTHPASWEPKYVSHQLETYIRNANDRIAQRNDTEQRHSRQRMGTTVVMAVNHGHQVFLAHVGDSRAYRITKTGCYQVTLDDDLAAREVRLGYALYREALQHSSSGSLIQALGMGGSYNLHPNVQKFAIDEDCIFLLCSDGLSDRDRIDQYWETLVLPVLEGKKDLGTLAKELLDLANSLNGHDNVTIGLLYCQARLSPQAEQPQVPPPANPTNARSGEAQTKIQLPGNATFIQQSPIPVSTISSVPREGIAPNSKPNIWRWGWLIPLILLAGAAGGIYVFFPQLFGRNTSSSEHPVDLPPYSEKGNFYRTKVESTLEPEAKGAPLTIPAGSFIWVPKLNLRSDKIEVKVCTTQSPITSSATQSDRSQVPSSNILKGYIQTSTLKTSELLTENDITPAENCFNDYSSQ